MSITVLVKSYEIFMGDTSKIVLKERVYNLNNDFIDDSNSETVEREIEREKEKEKERRESHKMAALMNVKDLGKTARYFASFCLKAMENQDMNPSPESSSAAKSTYALISKTQFIENLCRKHRYS